MPGTNDATSDSVQGGDPARKRRVRNTTATRAAILEAARTLLAKDGPDGVSLSEVAKLAGVNRGTAYQHFATREAVIDAAVAGVSDEMFRAVFGDPETIGTRDVGQVDMAALTERLAVFAMENQELCRIWLQTVLASPEPSPEPSRDPFWNEFEGSIARFAQTDLAEPGIDSEVWSVIVLAGNFLWPMWARAHSHGNADRGAPAHRFAREMLRLSMHGTVRIEKYPEIAALLEGEAAPSPRLLRAV